jgi:hypothetical protein
MPLGEITSFGGIASFGHELRTLRRLHLFEKGRVRSRIEKQKEKNRFQKMSFGVHSSQDVIKAMDTQHN